MLLLVISDQGVDTRPIAAANPQAMISELQQRYADGLNSDGVTPVEIAVVLPYFTGQITPNGTGTGDFTATGDSATLHTLVTAAQTALANNHTFLALPSPTAAQSVAQVQALTRQIDALIRLAVGDLSGTN